jgi:hypothetical protein
VRWRDCEGLGMNGRARQGGWVYNGGGISVFIASPLIAGFSVNGIQTLGEFIGVAGE